MLMVQTSFIYFLYIKRNTILDFLELWKGDSNIPSEEKGSSAVII